MRRTPGEADSLMGQENDIRKRDAFYAFEHSMALWNNSKKPDFYYEGEDAGLLADAIELALIELATACSDLEHDRRRAEFWLAQMGDVKAHYTAQAKVRELVRSRKPTV